MKIFARNVNLSIGLPGNPLIEPVLVSGDFLVVRDGEAYEHRRWVRLDDVPDYSVAAQLHRALGVTEVTQVDPKEFAADLFAAYNQITFSLAQQQLACRDEVDACVRDLTVDCEIDDLTIAVRAVVTIGDKKYDLCIGRIDPKYMISDVAMFARNHGISWATKDITIKLLGSVARKLITSR